MGVLFLYSQPISTRGVSLNLKRFRNVKPSHVTIYNLVVKFASYLIKISNKKPISFTNIWHVDEKFIKLIKVRGSKNPYAYLCSYAYLWIVSDSKSNILATHVSFVRDKDNAKIALEKAQERAGFNPELLISDGLQGYKKAYKKLSGRKTRHVIAHFGAVGIVHKEKLMRISNNRAGRINEFPALWLHSLRGFKRLDRASNGILYYLLQLLNAS